MGIVAGHIHSVHILRDELKDCLGVFREVFWIRSLEEKGEKVKP